MTNLYYWKSIFMTDHRKNKFEGKNFGGYFFYRGNNGSRPTQKNLGGFFLLWEQW